MKDISEGTVEKLVSKSDGEDDSDNDDPKYQIKASYFVI